MLLYRINEKDRTVSIVWSINKNELLSASEKEKVYTFDEILSQLEDFRNNRSEIFENLRKKTGLPLDKKINTFSKGMKRQAIVIIGLACRTDYLLLDEAFDGLDPTMRIIVKKMIVDAMLDRQLTTIISSHNLKEINEVCDKAALIHEGKIVFSRDIDDVKGSVHKIQVVFNKKEDGTVAAYSKEDFAQEGIEILHFEQSQSICFIIAKGDIEAIKASLLIKDPMITEVIPLTLEEIFIYELEVLGYDSSDNNGE